MICFSYRNGRRSCAGILFSATTKPPGRNIVQHHHTYPEPLRKMKHFWRLCESFCDIILVRCFEHTKYLVSRFSRLPQGAPDPVRYLIRSIPQLHGLQVPVKSCTACCRCPQVMFIVQTSSGGLWSVNFHPLQISRNFDD